LAFIPAPPAKSIDDLDLAVNLASQVKDPIDLDIVFAMHALTSILLMWLGQRA
jgi:hypothetical protein